MNDNIYPIAKIGLFEEILCINKSDLPFIGKERAMEVKTVRLDLSHKTIDEPIELEIHLKFNPWEEITTEEDRTTVSSKIESAFTKDEIENKVVGALTNVAIR
ncbi:MAG: hypothetical protein HY225_01925 [Candidatus Vogelbacteria bacterium]|nr:hypothetical protein [Candidatus Vogelbacteria bacterium]